MKRQLLAVAAASLFAMPAYASFTASSITVLDVAATMTEPFPYGNPAKPSASFLPAGALAHDAAVTITEPFPYGHPAMTRGSFTPAIARR